MFASQLIVKNIFDGMLDNYDDKKIGRESFRMLRSLATSGSHIPSNYMLKFELSRL